MIGKKTVPRAKHEALSTRVTRGDDQSQVYNESIAIDTGELKSAGNRSQLPSLAGHDSSMNKSLVFGSSPKGSYELKKMYGR